VAEHRDQREIAAARAEQAEPDRTARSRSPRSTSTSTPGAGAWVDPVRVSRVSWDRPWDTKPVLPGPCVLWEPWGVPSVLVERHEHFDGALVMRKSRVRIPQAVPGTHRPRSRAVRRAGVGARSLGEPMERQLPGSWGALTVLVGRVGSVLMWRACCGSWTPSSTHATASASAATAAIWGPRVARRMSFAGAARCVRAGAGTLTSTSPPLRQDYLP
jgi:hypothetical protein